MFEKRLDDQEPLFSPLAEHGYIGIGMQLISGDGDRDDSSNGSGSCSDTYLRFPSGSFVLFGPNGVGKSRVLRALREALGAKPDPDSEFVTVLFKRAIDARFHELRAVANRVIEGPDSDRYPRWENRPAELAMTIAEERYVCFRRGPEHDHYGDQISVGISQDSEHEIVRQAVARLFKQLRAPFEEPQAMADFIDSYQPDWCPVFADADDPDIAFNVQALTEDGIEWLRSPEGQAAIRAMPWRHYAQMLETVLPADFFDADEPLLGGSQWTVNFGRFVEHDRPAWAPWPLEWWPVEDSLPQPPKPKAVQAPLKTWLEDGRDGFLIQDVDDLTADPNILLDGTPAGGLKTVGARIAELATTLLERFLVDPVRIEYGQSLEDTSEWHFYSHWTNRAFSELDGFSSTQKRWIATALNLAALIVAREQQLVLSRPDLRSPVSLIVTCDEPELGLPPAGQRHLSRGLSSTAQEFGVTFILASHSSAVLADESFELVRVGRTASHYHGEAELDRVTLYPIDGGERSRLETVGVAPSEMLHLYKTILLVEGLHDLWVLDELIGTELDALRVKIVPVHGAKQAAALFASEAGLIFEHTPEANFVVAVDGTEQHLLDAMLGAARADKEGRDRLAEIDAIVQGGQPSDEAKVMHALLRKAIETDRLSRLSGLFGFAERDIIEYLEPSAFGLAIGWPELRSEHAEQLKTTRGAARDFKRWLELTYEANFDEVTIRSAVTQDSIPDEMLELLELCRSAGQSNQMTR